MIKFVQAILKNLSNAKISLKSSLASMLDIANYKTFSNLNLFSSNQNLSLIALIDSKNKSSSSLKIFKQNLFDKLKENSYRLKNKLFLLTKKQANQKHRSSMRSELIMAYLGDEINQEKTNNLIKTSIANIGNFSQLKNSGKQLSK